jgi:hypothetical protein
MVHVLTGHCCIELLELTDVPFLTRAYGDKEDWLRRIEQDLSLICSAVLRHQKGLLDPSVQPLCKAKFAHISACLLRSLGTCQNKTSTFSAFSSLVRS